MTHKAKHSVPDVSGLVPDARPIVQKVSSVYLKHTAPWFSGLIVHGSAVKGGVIPNCSDIDFQLYLRDAAFSARGQLPLELGMAVRRRIETGTYRRWLRHILFLIAILLVVQYALGRAA